MSLFRHPHLIRGVVHTPQGAFIIHRGVAEVPDDVGDALGWARLEDDRPAPRPRTAVMRQRLNGQDDAGDGA
jgi:hypothetical protein